MFAWREAGVLGMTAVGRTDRWYGGELQAFCASPDGPEEE
jgi:hypothetical protein